MNGIWGYEPSTGVNTPVNLPYIIPAQQPTSSGSFMTVIVNGEAGANTYPVAAGNTVLLIDFNTSQFWLKSTDMNSVPQPLRTFKFNEVMQATPAAPDTSEFVTKSELADIRKMLEDLTAQLK